MKIVSVDNKKVEACATFEYKGFEISASTIFRNPSVFVCDPRSHEFLSPELYTVEAAVKWIEDNDHLLKLYNDGEVNAVVLTSTPAPQQ